MNLSISLIFNYEFLLRWLLKVSFNSSRADGAHAHLFDKYIPFILGDSIAPLRNEVAVIAYLAAPEYLGKSKLKDENFIKIANGAERLNPFLVRISYGAVQGGDNYTLRVNVFGPLVFYLLFFQGKCPSRTCSCFN